MPSLLLPASDRMLRQLTGLEFHDHSDVGDLGFGVGGFGV